MDSATLAHLLRTDLVPRAYASSPEVRDRRELLRSRAVLVGLRASRKNRIHALLAKGGLHSPVSDLFGRQWLATVVMESVYRATAEGYLRLINALGEEIEAISRELRSLVKEEPQAQLLMSLPGIGYYSALVLLAEIGDLGRFPCAATNAYPGAKPRTAPTLAVRDHVPSDVVPAAELPLLFAPPHAMSWLRFLLPTQSLVPEREADYPL